MAHVRIYEDGKSIKDTIIEDCDLDCIPNVGDFVMIDWQDAATRYEVKSRTFMTSDDGSEKLGQFIALGVKNLVKTTSRIDVSF